MDETEASVVQQAVALAVALAVSQAAEQAVELAAAGAEALLPLITWCWKDLEPGAVAAEL